MGNLWLKIKVWTKITVFALVVIYLLLFIFKNDDRPATIWIFFNNVVETTEVWLIIYMLLAGVIGTLLLRMAFRTTRQIREMQENRQAAQLQRDAAEIREKAAMLKTKGEPSANAGDNRA